MVFCSTTDIDVHLRLASHLIDSSYRAVRMNYNPSTILRNTVYDVHGLFELVALDLWLWTKKIVSWVHRKGMGNDPLATTYSMITSWLWLFVGGCE